MRLLQGRENTLGSEVSGVWRLGGQTSWTYTGPHDYESAWTGLLLLLLKFEGCTVAQLIEALRYKPEGRVFDSRYCLWHNPSGHTMALRSTQTLTEMSTRNISWRGEGGKSGRCVGLKPLPPSCAECHEIREPQPRGTVRPVPGSLLLTAELQ